MDFGPISVGVSTQNLWLGPGRYSSLLMSNNAQGFNHFNIQTNRPLKTPLGSFQFTIIGGTLTANAEQGFENLKLQKSSLDPKIRYLNVLSVIYSPILFKNFFIGANRAFQQFSQTNPSNNLTDYYFITLKPLFRNTYQDNSEAVDQLISGFAKYIFPKEHAEVYFEYGWNDGASNSRDLMLDISHSAASIYGFKKIQYLNQNSYLKFEAEATKMSQRPSYLQRNAGNWYIHGRLDAGYTNENQILGAGSGLGNDLQTFVISYNKGWNKYGIKFQHIAQNPMIQLTNWPTLFLGDINWDDYSYGIQIKHKHKHFLFNLNIDYVHSKNYLWTENKNVTNLYMFLNTIYLW